MRIEIYPNSLDRILRTFPVPSSSSSNMNGDVRRRKIAKRRTLVVDRSGTVDTVGKKDQVTISDGCDLKLSRTVPERIAEHRSSARPNRTDQLCYRSIAILGPRNDRRHLLAILSDRAHRAFGKIIDDKHCSEICHVAILCEVKRGTGVDKHHTCAGINFMLVTVCATPSS
jgi:hypothetical protein